MKILSILLVAGLVLGFVGNAVGAGEIIRGIVPTGIMPDGMEDPELEVSMMETDGGGRIVIYKTPAGGKVVKTSGVIGVFGGGGECDGECGSGSDGAPPEVLLYAPNMYLAVDIAKNDRRVQELLEGGYDITAIEGPFDEGASTLVLSMSKRYQVTIDMNSKSIISVEPRNYSLDADELFIGHGGTYTGSTLPLRSPREDLKDISPACSSDISDDTVIVLYWDSCVYCAFEKQVVENLTKEGYKFCWVNAKDDNARAAAAKWVADDISGVPQFICAGTKETKLGYTQESELKKFSDACNQ